MTAVASCPAAASEHVDAWDDGRDPVTIVTNGWVDVRGLLRSVSGSAGLGLQMAPDVQGQVNVHLENVRLGQALDAMLEPIELGYEVVDDVIVVHKRGMVTRWFTFDYPVTHREGRGELQISSSREDGGSGGGSGDDSNQNKSHLTSTATMSIWPEVMKSLQVLVFRDAHLDDHGQRDEQELALNVSDSQGRSLVVNPMASLVQVTAEWDRVRRVDELLRRLQESLQRQVAIEVRIMEVYLDKDTQTGINWEPILRNDFGANLRTFDAGDGIGPAFFQFVVDSRDLNGVMQAISRSGDLRTISSPRVTTLNNQKAVVRVVTEEVYFEATVSPALITSGVGTEPVINYTPRVVPVGVVLDVTPQVGNDRVITLNVHPTISDVVGVAMSPNLDSVPVLSIRELDTVGKVRDGQTLIVAGLMSERLQMVRTGIPLLKDVPLLGYIFGKTAHRTHNIELVMLLTPVIMEEETADVLARTTQALMEERLRGDR
jgi:MSHA biogenesis protein MshL